MAPCRRCFLRRPIFGLISFWFSVKNSGNNTAPAAVIVTRGERSPPPPPSFSLYCNEQLLGGGGGTLTRITKNFDFDIISVPGFTFAHQYGMRSPLNDTFQSVVVVIIKLGTKGSLQNIVPFSF